MKANLGRVLELIDDRAGEDLSVHEGAIADRKPELTVIQGGEELSSPTAESISFVQAAEPEPGALIPSICLSCGTVVSSDRTERHRHTWCPSDCFDQWEAIQPGDNLSDAFPGRRTGRQIIESALDRHECPDGCGPLELRDHARDVWYCPSCRLWVTEGRIH